MNKLLFTLSLIAIILIANVWYSKYDELERKMALYDSGLKRCLREKQICTDSLKLHTDCSIFNSDHGVGH